MCATSIQRRARFWNGSKCPPVPACRGSNPTAAIDSFAAVARAARCARFVGPGEAGIAAPARCRDAGNDAAGPGIDLLDTILRNLKQVPAVEGRARMGGDVDLAHRLSARRVERVQLVSGGKPDVLAVIGDAIDAFDAGEGTILGDDFGGGSFHACLLITKIHAANLVAREGSGE